MAAFDRAVELSPTPGDVERRRLRAVAGRRRPRARAAICRVARSRRSSAASRNLDVEHADARARRDRGHAGGLLGHARLGLLRQRGSRAGPRPTSPRAWAIEPASPRSATTSGRSTKARPERGGDRTRTPRRCRPRRPAAMVREHLARVAGGAAKVDALVAAHRGGSDEGADDELDGERAGRQEGRLPDPVRGTGPGRGGEVRRRGRGDARDRIRALGEDPRDRRSSPTRRRRRSCAAASRPAIRPAGAPSRCCCRRMRSR